MADQNINNMSVTWNSGGTTFAAEKMNVTDTASAAASLLQQWQVGGVNKWAVGKDGSITAAGNASIAGNATITGTFGVTGAVDLNAGVIDGVVIGGAVPAAITGTTIAGSTGTFTGVIKAPVGSAAAPAYTFTAEPDCGMYQVTANFLRWSTGGSLSMSLGGAGQDLTVTGDITANSDERFKKDWADLDSDFIEKLAAVRMGTYTRIDSGIRQVGVGAQSLQKVMPEAVLRNLDDEDDEYLSVAYGNAALAACVALAREVCRLRVMIEAMK